VPARIKTFDEAKAEVTVLYEDQAKKEALLSLAESTLENFDQNDAIISDFVKLEENVNLNPLNSQESLQFLQKLFTSSKEKGIISVFDKVIVYNILEQKLQPMDENQTGFVKETVSKLKQSTFESNLIKMLDKQYPTEVYMGGLTN
jgi:peptidyl-prolyl cis-trans isomerase D